MLEIGTLNRVELEDDRMRQFVVRIGRTVCLLAHGTCYVVLGCCQIVEISDWWEVLILIANGEHAGCIAAYSDRRQHETLSVRLAW